MDLCIYLKNTQYFTFDDPPGSRSISSSLLRRVLIKLFKTSLSSIVIVNKIFHDH